MGGNCYSGTTVKDSRSGDLRQLWLYAVPPRVARNLHRPRRAQPSCKSLNSDIFPRHEGAQAGYHSFMNRFILITPLLLAAVIVLLAMSVATPSHSAQENPTELGTVSWIRDLEKGLALAKTKNRDVFLLFQEVPG